MSEKMDRELSNEELEKASGGKAHPAGQLGSAAGQAGKPLGAPGLSADLSDDRRELLVHYLDERDPQALVADIKRRYERRLQEIFG